MPIAYRAGAGTTVASRTSLVFTIPSTCVTGDECFSYLEIDNNPTVTKPADWTTIGVGTGVTGGYLYRHTVLSSDTPGTTTATFSWTGSNFCQGAIDAYSGEDSTTPEDATATVNTGSNTPGTHTGLTTVTNNAWALGFFFQTDLGGTHADAGFATERRDQSSTALYESVISPAGATGNFSTSFTGGAADWIAMLVALRPDTTPVGVPLGTPTWTFPHPPLV